MGELKYKEIKNRIKNEDMEKHTKELHSEKINPIYIVFDSANLTGKTTIINKVKERMLENGFNVKVLKQPFYPSNRRKLLSGELGYIDEYNLFYDDRLNLLIREVWKSDCDVVLMDRSFVSSLCYQGLKFNDFDNISKISSDSLNLYNKLRLTMDMGINLYCDPNIMSDRHTDDGEYDYRDTNNIDKIKEELEQYEIAWEIAVDLGLVDLLYTVKNNTIEDMNRIVDKVDNFVLEKIRGRDNNPNKLTDSEAEKIGDLLEEC